MTILFDSLFPLLLSRDEDAEKELIRATDERCQEGGNDLSSIGLYVSSSE
jgi:hypothetical protein